MNEQKFTKRILNGISLWNKRNRRWKRFMMDWIYHNMLDINNIIIVYYF